jgi:hypothetical protein
MVQHFVVDPLQSESALQSSRPTPAAAQIFSAPDTSDRSTQAWPIVVSHFESLEQKIGHDAADWQTLPPDP